MDQKSRLYVQAIQPHGGFARLLHYPFTVWMIGGRTAVDLAGADMNEDEHMRGENTPERVHALGKEVAADKRVHMRVNEVGPGDRRLLERLVRSRMDTPVLQNLPNGRGADRNTQLFEFAHDSSVSPTEVLVGQTEDETHCGRRRGWPAGGLEGDSSFGLTKPSPIRRGANHLSLIHI